MRQVARKKIIFVIVEGPSDETALGVILNRIFDNNTVYVHIVHTDITTEFINAPNKNIYTMVADLIRSYANSNHFKKTDFKEIIHLIDTDGAYIPDENIIEDDSAVNLQYSTTSIRTQKKAAAEHRNKMKRERMDKLCSRKEIWNVPYRAFYMSCNLDHVLFNKLNISDDEKDLYAHQFAKKYKDCIPDFIKFISESDFSVLIGYKESWDFIKKELNSLNRYTNLGLCFIDEEDETSNNHITDSLCGILQENYNDKKTEKERIEEHNN